MSRTARLVVPGYAHHVTQRGGRRQQTFFSDRDYRMYIDLLAKSLQSADCDIWAYCLMPNHVHLVVVPHDEDSLCRLLRGVHREYARRINKRNGWQGHLWQERFRSFVMQEAHAIAAVRYVELNPVRAGLCPRAQDWPWSSVHAHLAGRDDRLVSVAGMRAQVDDWAGFLDDGDQPADVELLRCHAVSGLPVGSVEFVDQLENDTGQSLRPRPRGPRR